MARSPNQLANLEKGKATQFKAGEKQAKIASKGGKKSQEVQRAKRTMRQELEILLAETIKSKDGKTEITVQEAGMRALTKKYLSGDIRATEFIRDTVGQKPAEQVLISEVDPDIMKQVEAAVNGQTAGD